jgi:hypothetical protein
MKGLRLSPIALGFGVLIVCGSAALAFEHGMRYGAGGVRYFHDGRSVGFNRFGPAGATPFNPAGTTPFNPAGTTPFNPAGETPFNPAGGGLR